MLVSMNTSSNAIYCLTHLPSQADVGGVRVGDLALAAVTPIHLRATFHGQRSLVQLLDSRTHR
jgi:hypothetical protein